MGVKNMVNWYSFDPIDTIFFRGSEPMVMGESHDANFNFPPPSKTIAGAIRTYFYKSDKENYKDIIRVGKENGGFNLIGPLFMENSKVYIPVPYTWYVESNKNGRYDVIKADLVDSKLIKSSSGKLLWAKGGGTVSPLGGKWVQIDDLNKTKNVELKDTDDFYSSEPRTGIALNKNKSVRKSHIYSFNHCRLNEGVSLIFGIDVDELGESGVLTLGAEQRFGRYKKEDIKIAFSDEGDKYLALSQTEGNEITNSAVIATGKIQYLGGWDLHLGFHKPMRGYFPAGTVFDKKFDNCIAIK